MRSTGAAGGARGLPDGGPAPPRGGAARVRARGWLFGGALGVLRYDVFLPRRVPLGAARARRASRRTPPRPRASRTPSARAPPPARTPPRRDRSRSRRARSRARSRAGARARARRPRTRARRALRRRGGTGGARRRKTPAAARGAPASADAAPREEEGAGRIMIARAARRAREPRSARRGREPRRSLLSETDAELPTSLSFVPVVAHFFPEKQYRSFSPNFSPKNPTTGTDGSRTTSETRARPRLCCRRRRRRRRRRGAPIRS